MAVRDLTIVLLRLMGVWLICSAVLMFASYCYMWLDSTLSGPQTMFRASLGQLIFPTIHAVLAVALIRCAPKLADRICTGLATGTAETVRPAVGPGDLYHIGCFLMGIFVLVRAVRPAIAGVAAMIAQGPRRQMHLAAQDVVSLVEAGLLIGFGLLLAVGARGIAGFLTSLGRDPDRIPQQQFSLQWLMFVLAGCALLLVVIRLLLK